MNLNNLPPGSVILTGGFAVMHRDHYATLVKIAEAYFELAHISAHTSQTIERLKAEYAKYAENQSASGLSTDTAEAPAETPTTGKL